LQKLQILIKSKYLYTFSQRFHKWCKPAKLQFVDINQESPKGWNLKKLQIPTNWTNLQKLQICPVPQKLPAKILKPAKLQICLKISKIAKIADFDKM